MKKKYIIPEVEEMEIELLSILCLSGDIGGDASEPALAPDLDDNELLI